MKQGALIFDEQADRYDIRFDLADKPTRIEMAEDWYLVGVRADDLSGLRVRI